MSNLVRFEKVDNELNILRIFYLDDAIGYLFLSKEEKANDVGVFFVQCT